MDRPIKRLGQHESALGLFRPTCGPEASIYDAFQSEASLRPGRSFEEWHRAEVAAVLRASVEAAELYGLRPPTRDDIQRSERLACGHVDYGAKWAIYVVQVMRSSRAGMPE